MNAPLLFAVPDAATYFCSGCNEVKPASDFTPTNRKRSRARRRCHRCVGVMLARYRKHNPVRYAGYDKRQHAKRNDKQISAHLVRRYGITLSEKRAMLVAQNFKCAVNGEPISEGGGLDTKAQVEHDHLTGKIRGLSCRACNLAMGVARDDIARLVACAEYLSRHKEKI